MAELLFDEDEIRTVWATPDPSGVTLRTQYKCTQEILDRASRFRVPKHTRVPTQGSAAMPVGDVPIEIYELYHVYLQRPPSAGELGALVAERDFSRCRTTEKTFPVAPGDRATVRGFTAYLRKLLAS